MAAPSTGRHVVQLDRRSPRRPEARRAGRGEDHRVADDARGVERARDRHLARRPRADAGVIDVGRALGPRVRPAGDEHVVAGGDGGHSQAPRVRQVGDGPLPRPCVVHVDDVAGRRDGEDPVFVAEAFRRVGLVAADEERPVADRDESRVVAGLGERGVGPVVTEHAVGGVRREQKARLEPLDGVTIARAGRGNARLIGST